MPQAELLSGARRLHGIEADWWALWRRCPGATPFQSPAWLLAWWDAFAPGRLATVAVWDGADLVGLAPLYVEEASRRLLPLGIGISDYLDLLIDPASAQAVGPAILAALDAVPDWTSISLEELAPGAAGLQLPAPAGWSSETQAQSACPTLALPERARVVGDAIPSRKLRKLRMARHRAARRHARIERGDPSLAESHLEALFSLHTARWTSRGEAGVLADAAVRRFHAAALPRLVKHGVLRSLGLRIDDRIVGVFYGFASGTRLFAYLGGFDPAYGFESPGTVLMGEAIEDAMGDGIREIHLLRGQEPYKYEWGALDRWNSRRVLSRAAPGGSRCA